VEVRSGETPGSLVAGSRRRSRGRRRSGVTTRRRGRGNWPVRSMKRNLQRRDAPRPRCRAAKREPSRSHNGEGHGRREEPGRAASKNPPAYLGVERSDGRPGNWRGPPRPGPAGARAGLPITAAREVAASREGVGGGRSSEEGRDNTTRSERRTPASSTHPGAVRRADECRAHG
jgi:hypothetical protein